MPLLPINLGSPGAIVACERLLANDILNGYRMQSGPPYSRAVNAFEAELRLKLGIALAKHRSDFNGAVRELKAALAMAPQGGFTGGPKPEDAVALTTIALPVVEYCGQHNTAAAIKGLKEVRGVWRAYALAVLGRIYIETDQVEKGIARLNEARCLGISGATAKREAKKVLLLAEKDEPLPDSLKLSIELLVADF